jgi:hypothetical protein
LIQPQSVLVPRTPPQIEITLPEPILSSTPPQAPEPQTEIVQENPVPRAQNPAHTTKAPKVKVASKSKMVSPSQPTVSPIDIASQTEQILHNSSQIREAETLLSQENLPPRRPLTTLQRSSNLTPTTSPRKKSRLKTKVLATQDLFQIEDKENSTPLSPNTPKPFAKLPPSSFLTPTKSSPLEPFEIGSPISPVPVFSARLGPIFSTSTSKLTKKQKQERRMARGPEELKDLLGLEEDDFFGSNRKKPWDFLFSLNRKSKINEDDEDEDDFDDEDDDLELEESASFAPYQDVKLDHSQTQQNDGAALKSSIPTPPPMIDFSQMKTPIKRQITPIIQDSSSSALPMPNIKPEERPSITNSEMGNLLASTLGARRKTIQGSPDNSPNPKSPVKLWLRNSPQHESALQGNYSDSLNKAFFALKNALGVTDKGHEMVLSKAERYIAENESKPDFKIRNKIKDVKKHLDNYKQIKTREELQRQQLEEIEKKRKEEIQKKTSKI